MLKVCTDIRLREVIAALNVEPPSAQVYAAVARKYITWANARYARAMENVIKTWAASMDTTPSDVLFRRNYLVQAPTVHVIAPAMKRRWLPPSISRREGLTVGEALVSAYLRDSVDAWLETGIAPDGSEAPGMRRVPPGLTHTIYDFLEECPPEFTPSGDEVGFELLIAQRRPSRHRVHNFFHAQRIEAARLLVGFVASDWKDRVCKCRYRLCERYFVHPAPRRVYRHGTFCCRSHQKSASAGPRTKQRRQQMTSRLIDEAAKQLIKWGIGPGWQEDKYRKSRLAAFLTKRIDLQRDLRAWRTDVRINWVTGHSTEIEQRRLHLAI